MPFRADAHCPHCGQWHVVWIAGPAAPRIEEIEFLCPATRLTVLAALAFFELPGELPQDAIIVKLQQ